jgi:hypothetical protein
VPLALLLPRNRSWLAVMALTGMVWPAATGWPLKVRVPALGSEVMRTFRKLSLSPGSLKPKSATVRV